MRLTLPLSVARPLIFATVSARLIMGVFLDMPWLYNAGWISALAALVLCVPLGMLADRFTRLSGPGDIAGALEREAGKAPTRIICGALCLLAIYETAVTARVLSNTVRHVALSEASAISLLLPLLIVAMLAAYFNGLALGSAARIWVKIIPFLLLIVILLQMKSYHAAWLTPVLGPGAEVLATGAVSASGWLSLTAMIWLCAEKDDHAASLRTPVLGPVLITGIYCALVLALLAMMSPPSVRTDLTRTYQLDKMLANGRASQASQLPLIILWYNSLIFTVSTNLFLGAKLMQLTIPKLDGRLAVLFAGVAAGTAAMFGLAEQGTTVELSQWLFALVGALFAVLLLLPVLKGGKKACARSK